jgi:hypothetical protein
VEEEFLAEALAIVRDGFFSTRRRYKNDSRLDLEDARSLSIKLIKAKDDRSIVELARTENTWQRDGVASALQAAPQDADDFVDDVVHKLLRAH